MLITLAFLSRVSPLARPFPFYHRSTASRLFSTVPDASTSPHNTNSNFHDTILPPSNSNNNNNNSNNNSRPGASAGAGVYHSKLHNFPVPPSMDMILSRSYKASLKAIVPSTSSLPNAKLRTIKSTSIRLSVYGSTAGVLIRDCIAGYRSVLGDSELSDFERVCIDLTMQAKVDRDGTDLRELIKELDERRKGFVRLTKDLAAESKTFQSAKGANQHKIDSLKLLETYLVTELSPVLKTLQTIGKSLRTTPVVNPTLPTVVLVGCPNVGKSSIVRKVSTGKPEIAGYAFTTRGLTIGHLDVMRRGELTLRCQVMDSPGLLVREEEGEEDYDIQQNISRQKMYEEYDNEGKKKVRNKMELLTLASIACLPTAVCFVFDLSETAGDHHSSVEAQIKLRDKLRRRFPKRPWLDVVTKSDLLPPSYFTDPDNEVRKIVEGYGARYVSAGGEGVEVDTIVDQTVAQELISIDELKIKFGSTLLDVNLVLKAIMD